MGHIPTFSIVGFSVSSLTLATAQTSLNIALIEAHFSNAGIVPSLLPTFDPSATLNVSFAGVGTITPGQALSKDQVAPAPTIAITPANSTVSLSGKYTVVMADADVVGKDESAGQTRHWLVNSVPISSDNVSTSDGTTITNYAGPGPAPGSGAHRYVILVLPQPDNFAAPANLSAPNTPLGVFNLVDYISSTHLGQPIAGMYFTVEEGTASASASPTSAVNTQSISAALAAASSTSPASHSASGTAPGSSPTGSAASAGQLVSGPLALVATLFGLVML
jgi:hypothetical protein